MGLVQSQSAATIEAIEVDGLLFNIESSLKGMVSLYGNIVVDLKKSFLGETFSARFSQAGGCGCS